MLHTALTEVQHLIQILIDQRIFKHSYVCCSTVCSLSPRQTMHVVRFPKPPPINWTKFLHRFWCPASFRMLSPPLPRSQQCQSCMKEALGAFCPIPVLHTCPRQAVPWPPTYHSGNSSLLSAAGPLTCSITTLNSVVVLLYSESKVSTNTNQWEKSTQKYGSNWKYFEKTAAFLFSHLPATVSSLQLSPDHVLVKGFTRLKNILNILKDILRMVKHLI